MKKKRCRLPPQSNYCRTKLQKIQFMK